MFFAAPFIDKIVYSGKYDNLTAYIRVLSLVLVISGLKNIQHAYVAKKMIFKKRSKKTLCSFFTCKKEPKKQSKSSGLRTLDLLSHERH